MNRLPALFLALALLTGCVSPSINKVIAATDVAVEHAMQAWGDHVSVERAKGNLLLNERRQVKDAYETYQLSLAAYGEVLSSTTGGNPEQALKLLSDSHSALVQLIWKLAPQTNPNLP